MMTWKELGEAVGKDAAALCRWSKRPTFPQDRDATKVKEWIAQNIPQKNKSVERQIASPQQTTRQSNPTQWQDNSARPVQWQDNSDDELVKELLGGKADSITICRAAFQFAAKKMAQSYSLGTLSSADLDGIKKTSQELRAAEVDFIELKKVQGEIMSSSDVEAIISEITARLIRCSSAAINDASIEFSIWLTDPAVAAMSQDDRSRKVREWLEEKFRAVRETEAESVTQMLASMASDDEE